MIIRSLTFSLVVTAVAMSGPLTAYLHSTVQGLDSVFNISRPGFAQAQENTDQIVPSEEIPDTPTNVSPFGNRSPSEGGIYSPPAVFVLGGNVPTETSGTISGTFTLNNRNPDAVGDLGYRVELLNPEAAVIDEEPIVEEFALLFDQVVNDNALTLAPGEKIDIPFEYTPPNLPNGKYRLRIQVVTSHDRELGWYDFPVTITAANEPGTFVTIIPGTINHPDFPDELLPPGSGPNVDPAGTLGLRGTLENSVNAPTTVTPSLSTVRLGSDEEPVITTGASIAVPAGDATEFELPVTVSTSPGIYRSTLAMQAGEAQASNIVEYRWIVRGNDANIISARLVSAETSAGGQVEVAVDFAGPGDAESSFVGQLEVLVEDDKGQAGVVTVSDLSLSDVVEAGLARVTLTRDLAGIPQATINLKDESGAVLDTYTVAFDLTSAELAALGTGSDAVTSSNRSLAITLGSILVIALVILIGSLFIRSRNKGQAPPAAPSIPTPPTAILVALLVGAGLILGAYVTQAQAGPGSGNGITVVTPKKPCEEHRDWCRLDRYVVEVFVNRPLHNNDAAYDPQAVPLNYRVRWAVCTNSLSYSRTHVKFLAQGGNHTKWRPPGSQPWKTLSDKSRSTRSCPNSGRCFASSEYRAPNGINLVNLKEGAHRTMMQLQVLWAWHGVNPSWAEQPFYYNLYAPGSTLHSGFYGGKVHAVNLGLNLETDGGGTSPECSDDIDNDGDGGIDYDGVSCPGGGGGTNLPPQQTFSGGPFQIATLVANGITERGLPWTKPSPGNPLVRYDNGTGGGFRWNNDGVQHLPTLDAACEALGYDTYVRSTCLDTERSGRYPSGKCNFHSPYNDRLSRFTGNGFAAESAEPKYGKTWIASITCKDPIGDGCTEYPADPDCTGPEDPSETGGSCNDGRDNDGDGFIDMSDPGCDSPTDGDETDPAGEGLKQCNDGVDNDDDSKIDHANAHAEVNKNDAMTEMTRFVTVTGASRHSVGRSHRFLPQGNDMEFAGLRLSLGHGATRFSANGTQFTGFTRERVAISGFENFTVHLPQNTRAFGWEMYEPTTAPDIGPSNPNIPAANPAEFRESTFTVTFRNSAGQTVRTIQVNSDNDKVRFHSVWLDEPFRTVEFVENGTPGTDNFTNKQIENEFFGSFYTSARPRPIADPGCETPIDDSEREPLCSNGLDDDNDGFIDAADSGCHTDFNPDNPDSYNPDRDNEFPPQGECSDNIDNDGNEDIDGADPQCHTDNNPNNPNSYVPTRSEKPDFSPGPIRETE